MSLRFAASTLCVVAAVFGPAVYRLIRPGA